MENKEVNRLHTSDEDLSDGLIIEVKDRNGNILERKESDMIIGVLDESFLMLGKMSEDKCILSACKTLKYIVEDLIVSHLLNDYSRDYTTLETIAKDMDDEDKQNFMSACRIEIDAITSAVLSVLGKELNMSKTKTSESSEKKAGRIDIYDENDNLMHSKDVNNAIVSISNDGVIFLGDMNKIKTADDLEEAFAAEVCSIVDYYCKMFLARHNECRTEDVNDAILSGNYEVLKMLRKKLNQLVKVIYEFNKSNMIQTKTEKGEVAVDIDELNKQMVENMIDKIAKGPHSSVTAINLSELTDAEKIEKLKDAFEAVMNDIDEDDEEDDESI